MAVKAYALPPETVVAVLQYLASRPYGEVVNLIQAVEQAKPMARVPK
jgi:hypothetical protein